MPSVGIGSTEKLIEYCNVMEAHLFMIPSKMFQRINFPLVFRSNLYLSSEIYDSCHRSTEEKHSTPIFESSARTWTRLQKGKKRAAASKSTFRVSQFSRMYNERIEHFHIDSVCGSVYRAFMFLDERDYHNGIRFSVGLKLAVAHSFSRKSHPKTSSCPIVSKCI